MEYERSTNTEKFYNTDRELILTVYYNRAGKGDYETENELNDKSFKKIEK